MSRTSPTSSNSWEPILPDFYVCSQHYGDFLNAASCFQLLEQLPRGDAPIAYTQRLLGADSHELPFYHTGDGCQISVELGGPGVEPGHNFIVAPDRIWKMAEYVIDQCAIGWGGVGGFITEGFGQMVNHVLAPNFDFGAQFRKLLFHFKLRNVQAKTLLTSKLHLPPFSQSP